MPWNPDTAPPRKHLKHYNIPGHSHYLTFSCFKRQPFLSKDRTCQWLAAAIIAARKKHDFLLLAYVFMPEHVHLLLHPKRRDYAIPSILQSIKLPVARRAARYVLEHAPEFIPRMRIDSPGTPLSLRFWQAGGGHDRNIYSPEERHEKITYIHNNPVKRKLTTHSTAFPWSSAADHARLRKGPLPVDPFPY